MAGRRLTIPAPRRVPRELLRVVRPYFLRAAAPEPQPAGPQLLSFESDAFMEEFIALAGGRRSLPRLLPWRDWSEPPAALLDGAGAPLYPVAALGRSEPLGHLPESGAGIDPDGIPSGTPPWIRKLYLPLHERFNLVALDLVCRSAGWPKVARQRVVAAGVVLRRLVADPTRERWEDWVAIDERRGLWIECLDADLAPLGGGTPVDPARLPETALLSHSARLRALLGIPATQPLAVALSSQNMALVPPDAGAAADHCSLFGYLPLFSAAREVPARELRGQTPAQLAAHLASATRTTLSALFADIGGLQTQAAAELHTLVEQGLLPDRPTAGELSLARDQIRFFPASPYGSANARDNAIATAVDQVLIATLRRLLDRDASDALRDAQIAGQVPTGQTLWDASGAAGSATQAGLLAGWIRDNAIALTMRWDSLVRERLHQVMGPWLDQGLIPAPPFGSSNTLQAHHLGSLLLLAMLRLRGARLGLAAHLARQIGWDDPTERLRAVDAAGNPAATVASLGEEVQAILDLEAGRADPRTSPPWPPIGYGGLAGAGRLLALHEAGLRLAALYRPLTAGLMAAGAAAHRQLQLQATAVADQLCAVFGLGAGLAPIRLRGVDLLEQPLLGPLVLPGLWPDPVGLDQFANAAADLYNAPGQPLALTEAQGRDQAPQLRFDADHLYGAWCWVRIAGRSDCELEQLIWSARSEPFSIADPTDLLGAKPAAIRMPDIPKLLRDLPRLGKAQAQPFAAITSPPQSGVVTGEEPDETRREWGIGFICSFGIPILTICALILFNLIFRILIVLPGFAWMLLLKICIPIPRRGP